MTDCSNPKNDQERNLCSCKKATESVTNAIDLYTKQYEEYSKNISSWNNWNSKHNDWKNKTGDFSKYKALINSKYQTFQYDYNVFTCNDITNTQDTNWRCGKRANELNYNDPWTFYNYQSYNTGGSGSCATKGLNCKRTDAYKNKIDNEYYAAEPTQADDKTVWLNKPIPTEPVFNFTANIQCCSQIFGVNVNVNGDGNNTTKFNNIIQECNQKINNRLSNTTGPSSTTPTSSPSSTYIVIILITILLFSSSSSLLLF